MNQDPVDLTLISVGFPEKPRDEISRESFVKMLADSFTDQEPIILVTGGYQTGKTTALAQFARQYSQTSISYFITSNPWSQNLYVFLLSICTQAAMALGLPVHQENIDTEELQSLLLSLSYKLAFQARKTGKRFYFVIDGLEYALSGPQGQRIIDVFPLFTDPKSPFILASCRTELISKIAQLEKIHKTPVAKFSLRDTTSFLSHLNISDDIVKGIHLKADGIPGYIKIIKDLLQTHSFKFNPDSLPSKFEELVAQQWKLIYDNVDSVMKTALEIIVAAPSPITLENLAKILKSDLSDLLHGLQNTGIIEVDPNCHSCVLSNTVLFDVAKNRLADKLDARRKTLVEFFEKGEKDQKSNELLSLLYKETGNYQGMQLLLAPDKVINNIKSEESLAAIYRNLSIACEMAQENPEISSTDQILKWGFGLSLLRLVMLQPVDENEIEALLAVGRIDEAKRRAYAIAEMPTKIRLLARAYIAQKKRGQRIPSEAQEELQMLVYSLDTKNIENDLLIQVASELFPIFPDLATSLLEKSIQSNEKRNIIDLALTAATLSSPVPPDNKGISNISDPDLAYVAKAHSSWLSDLPFQSLEQDLINIKATKAKEYLIRKWCRTNRKSIDLHQAINLWLDEVISDANYPIPLRSLRQLSDNLFFVLEDYRKDLIDRFDIPKITSLLSPKEELVRFLLNLAENVMAFNSSEATNRLENVKQIICDDIPDLDVKAYCLARLWLSTIRIRGGSCQETLIVKHMFWANIQNLLEQTADHLEITKGILETLVQIDPIQGIDLATRLNTLGRRNKAISIVLGHTLSRLGEKNWTEILDFGFGYSDETDHAFILSEIISVIDGVENLISEENIQYLRHEIQRLTDQGEKAKWFSIISLHAAKYNKAFANEIAKDSIDCWENMDDLRDKFTVGYQIAIKIADYNKNLAENLIDELEKLYLVPGSSFGTGNLGPAFVYAIKLALRAIQIQDLTNNDLMDAIKSQIKRLPSLGTQYRLLAELAAASYRCGYSILGDQITNEEIINNLPKEFSSLDAQKLLTFCAPIIYEYDSAKAKELLSKLSYSLREQSWYRTSLWILVRCQLEENIDSIELCFSSDYKRIIKAIDALENISYDSILHDAINAILNVADKSQEIRTIDPTQALEIARRLDQIANNKLPDDKNIKHDGYKLITLAGIQKLKSRVLEKNKARQLNITDTELQKGWKNIEKKAQKITNIADRVFVCIIIAQEMLQCKISKNMGEIVLETAYEQIKDIPSIIDRSGRLQIVASAYEKAGLKTQSRFVIEQATELVSQLEGVEKRNLISTLVQTAHKIDPDLAVDITNRFDSRAPNSTDQVALDSLETEKLVENPIQILGANMSESTPPWILSRAAKKLLKEVVSGRGTIHHEKIFNKWLYAASTTHISIFYDVAEWTIESLRRRGGSSMLFNELLGLSDLTLRLTESISPHKRLGISELNVESYPGLASKIHVFDPGERSKAIEWVGHWINLHANQYLKISDPYFEPSELLFFRDIPDGCKLLIVTTNKMIKGDQSEVLREFTQRWRSISSRHIPSILLYIVPSSLEDLFHDRAIITNGAGLDLGQSLNGLGLKSGKVTELADTDSKELETKYFDQMLNQSNWFLQHNTAPLVVQIF